MEQNDLDKKSEQILEPKEEKKSKSYKYFIYLFVIFLITGFVLYINLTQTATNSAGETVQVWEVIPELISKINWSYFALFIANTLIYFILGSVSLFLFARLYTRKYRYHQSLANHLIGFFYSAITPGSSGGQIAQVYTFKKQGVPVSNAASIFIMSYIVYQSVLLFLGVVSLITRTNIIMGIESIPADFIMINGVPLNIPIVVFIVLGFSLNVLVIVALFVMSYTHSLHNFIINKVVGLLGKLKLIKEVERTRENLRIQVQNFRVELKRLQSNVPFTILITFLTLLTLVAAEILPFVAGLALNAFDLTNNFNPILKMYDSIVFLNFHQMVTGLIPIPGSAGISELVFERLFGSDGGYFSASFYESGGLPFLLLLWRFSTFYIPFIITGVVAATYKSRGLNVHDSEKALNYSPRKTMLTIQIMAQEDDVPLDAIDYKQVLKDKKEDRKIKRNDRKEKKLNDKNDKNDREINL